MNADLDEIHGPKLPRYPFRVPGLFNQPFFGLEVKPNFGTRFSCFILLGRVDFIPVRHPSGSPWFLVGSRTRDTIIRIRE